MKTLKGKIEFDGALNEAGWALARELNKYGGVTGHMFNNLKSSLKVAIECYINEKEEEQAISQAKEVEWVNGELVCKVNQTTPIGIFVGLDRTGRAVIELNSVTSHANNGNAFMTLGLHNIAKPETQEDREKREELEAAYDLYCEWNCHPEHALSLDELKVEPDWRERWLRVVRKTGYRKGD